MTQWSYELEASDEDIKITIKLNNSLYISTAFGYFYPDRTERTRQALLWAINLTKRIIEAKEWSLPPFITMMNELIDEIKYLIP